MQVTVKELRAQPGRIISMVGSGSDIVITLRGKPVARTVPFDQGPADDAPDDAPAAFGMWKNREDMGDPSAFIARLREGRRL